MLFSIMISGSASAANTSEAKYEDAIKEIKKNQADFLSYLKNAKPKNEEEANKIAEEYYSKNKIKEEFLASYYKKIETYCQTLNLGTVLTLEST